MINTNPIHLSPTPHANFHFLGITLGEISFLFIIFLANEDLHRLLWGSLWVNEVGQFHSRILSWAINLHSFRDLEPAEWAPGNSRRASATQDVSAWDYCNVNFSTKTNPAHPWCFGCICFLCCHVCLFLQIHSINTKSFSILGNPRLRQWQAFYDQLCCIC